MRRWNITLWVGFAVVLLGLFSYEPLFARFPITRDVPWVNLLLLLAGGGLLAMGWKRAVQHPERYRGKITGPILSVLALVLAGLFCVGVFYLSKQVPAAAAALQDGQHAPDFALADAHGEQVSLSNLLKTNRAIVLIFYRGYW